ncbi:MAG: M20/M25/M40 family metallo-hydrolase [Oscillospiraceae bacterium]
MSSVYSDCTCGRDFTPERSLRPGPLMARANEVTITVTGKSVHLSRAAEGRDALAAGLDYYRRALELVEALPPPRVLGFGRMVSGTVRNAVSGETHPGGQPADLSGGYLPGLSGRVLIRLGVQVAEERGCEVDVHLSDGYPAVWNHEALYVQLCRELGPKAPALLDTPVLAAEDFSFYQQRVPGVFFFLGVGETASFTLRSSVLTMRRCCRKALRF